ncbi:hypothetical protein APA_5249 [Pseudanabaena sp. lw0831]|nr:hypothetical protein APA_5249 [Pseudanabaena sp. lw0831]
MRLNQENLVLTNWFKFAEIKQKAEMKVMLLAQKTTFLLRFVTKHGGAS